MDDLDLSSIKAKPYEPIAAPARAGRKGTARAPPANDKWAAIDEAIARGDAAKKAAPAKDAKPDDEPSSDAATSRASLINTLKELFDAFPVKLKDLEPKNFDKLSDEALDRLREKIHARLMVKGAIDGMAARVPDMLMMAEGLIGAFTPLLLYGTHKAFRTDDMQDILKYAIIEAGLVSRTMTPMQHICMTLVQAAGQQHFANAQIVAQVRAQQAAASPQTAPSPAPAANPSPNAPKQAVPNPAPSTPDIEGKWRPDAPSPSADNVAIALDDPKFADL